MKPLTIRFGADHLAHLHRRAELRGLSAGGYVRELVARDARGEGTRLVQPAIADRDDVLDELAARRYRPPEGA